MSTSYLADVWAAAGPSTVWKTLIQDKAVELPTLAPSSLFHTPLLYLGDCKRGKERGNNIVLKYLQGIVKSLSTLLSNHPLPIKILRPLNLWIQ